MPKIESIRPGGTLAATFSTYPLAELLLGILRGNLTGRLDVFLHPEPRNHVHFRDGVPVEVKLPDGGVSLVQVLVQDKLLSQQRGLELIRAAESAGRPASDVLRRQRVFSQVVLHQAEVRWARARMVRLFDAGPAEFRFTEGAKPDEAPLTILQPLPIVYEGLLSGRDRAVVQRFVGSHYDSRFTLSPTYPREVDPFEWGPKVESALEQFRQPSSLADLEGAGLAPEEASAVMTALHLTDMIELRAQGRARSGSAVPRMPSPVVLPVESDGAPTVAPNTPPGLTVHRRVPKEPPERVRSPPSPVSGLGQNGAAAAVGGSEHDREYVAVRDRLTPYFGQNYYQVLRVTPGSGGAQLDRAYRFLVRRLEEEFDRPGTSAVLDLIHEAYEVLKDAETADRYASLVERGETVAHADRERRVYEAEPKVDRAVRAMGSGRTGEATLLLSWAERLDPARTDLGAYFGVLDVIRAPDVQRAADARALRGVLQAQIAERVYDWRMKLCMGLVLAEDGDPWGATRLLEATPDQQHPMALRIAAALDLS